MAYYTETPMSVSVCLLLGLHFISGLPATVSGVSTVADMSVLEGRSVTVPCHYEQQYTEHVKYWCRGNVKDFCSTLARSDTPPTDARVSIIDDPTQLVFTVNMRDLLEADSAWYWCGVELGGLFKADATDSLYIHVIHGISVVNQMVIGEEGSSAIVQCSYSNRHRNSVKKWCRSGHGGSCLSLETNGTVQEGSVQITDDGRGTFTVTLYGLNSKDMGWYWCSAGPQQATVHIAVTPRSTTTAIVATTLIPRAHVTSAGPSKVDQTDEINTPSHSSHLSWQSSLMVSGVLLLLVLAVLGPWKMWTQHRKGHLRRRQMDTETALALYPDVAGDRMNTSVIYRNTQSQQVLIPEFRGQSPSVCTPPDKCNYSALTAHHSNLNK